MIVKDIRNKYILCCCMLIFFCSTICSKSFRYNGLKYNIISEDRLECEVTFNGKEYFEEPYATDSVKVGEYAVCDSTTYKVTRIGENAFYGCVNTTDIELPITINSIGASAFQGCVSLETINIPSGVKELADDVFGDCASLTDVTLPRGMEIIGGLKTPDEASEEIEKILAELCQTNSIQYQKRHSAIAAV